MHRDSQGLHYSDNDRYSDVIAHILRNDEQFSFADQFDHLFSAHSTYSRWMRGHPGLFNARDKRTRRLVGSALKKKEWDSDDLDWIAGEMVRENGRKSNPKKRYYPVAVPGTSSADHLNYEITERIPENGYATKAAAEKGWYRASKRANARRRTLGYAIFSRPSCHVEARRGNPNPAPRRNSHPWYISDNEWRNCDTHLKRLHSSNKRQYDALTQEEQTEVQGTVGRLEDDFGHHVDPYDLKTAIRQTRKVRNRGNPNPGKRSRRKSTKELQLQGYTCKKERWDLGGMVGNVEGYVVHTPSGERVTNRIMTFASASKAWEDASHDLRRNRIKSNPCAACATHQCAACQRNPLFATPQDAHAKKMIAAGKRDAKKGLSSQHPEDFYYTAAYYPEKG